MVKEQGDFPFLAGVRFYPLSKFSGPVTGIAFVVNREREKMGENKSRLFFNESKSIDIFHKIIQRTMS